MTEPKDNLAMNGEESAERVASGEGAGGDILCAGSRFVKEVSNLTLPKVSMHRVNKGIMVTNLEDCALELLEDNESGLQKERKRKST